MMLLLSAVVNPNWNEFKIEDDDIFEQCKLYLYVLRSVWRWSFPNGKNECFSNLGYTSLLAHLF